MRENERTRAIIFVSALIILYGGFLMFLNAGLGIREGMKHGLNYFVGGWLIVLINGLYDYRAHDPFRDT